MEDTKTHDEYSSAKKLKTGLVQRFKQLRDLFRSHPNNPHPQLPEIDSELYQNFRTCVAQKDAFNLGKCAYAFLRMGNSAKKCIYICCYYLFQKFSEAGQTDSKERFLYNLYKKHTWFSADALELGEKIHCLIGDNESLLEEHDVLAFPYYRVGSYSVRKE